MVNKEEALAAFLFFRKTIYILKESKNQDILESVQSDILRSLYETFPIIDLYLTDSVQLRTEADLKHFLRLISGKDIKLLLSDATTRFVLSLNEEEPFISIDTDLPPLKETLDKWKDLPIHGLI